MALIYSRVQRENDFYELYSMKGYHSIEVVGLSFNLLL